MQTDPRVIGCGLIILKAREERRGSVGSGLENPPQMFVVWYDSKDNELKKEPISFGAAQALAPEQFDRAMHLLERARRQDY